MRVSPKETRKALDIAELWSRKASLYKREELRLSTGTGSARTPTGIDWMLSRCGHPFSRNVASRKPARVQTRVGQAPQDRLWRKTRQRPSQGLCGA